MESSDICGSWPIRRASTERDSMFRAPRWQHRVNNSKSYKSHDNYNYNKPEHIILETHEIYDCCCESAEETITDNYLSGPGLGSELALWDDYDNGCLGGWDLLHSLRHPTHLA